MTYLRINHNRPPKKSLKYVPSNGSGALLWEFASDSELSAWKWLTKSYGVSKDQLQFFGYVVDKILI